MPTDKPYCLVLGAESDIGKAIAYRFAKAGYNLFLTSRNIEYINANDEHNNWENHFQMSVSRHFFEASDFESHQTFYRNLPKPPDVVIGVFGYLGNQKKAEVDFDEAQKIININYAALVSILHIAANDMEKRGSGCIIGISSVAGERGRKSNYIYGSAKGALSIFLSGLRNRLADKNVHVITVKPGYVRTKMTKDLTLPSWLTANPEQLAGEIYRACMQTKNIIYFIPLWRYVMRIIKCIPESLFKKLDL